MKHINKHFMMAVLAFTLLVGTLVVGNTAKADAATRKGYTITTANTRVYSNPGLTSGYGWIYPTDEVTVITVTSSYSKVSYPISGGRTKSGYISTSAILTATGGTTYTSRGKFTTYRRDNTGNVYGNVATNDKVLVLGTRGSFTQIKYPISGGYKYAFAKTSDVNTYLKSVTVATPVPAPVVTNSSYTVSGNLLTVNGVAMTDYRIGAKYTNSNYAVVNGKSVYMAGSQCCGYARYIAYKLYGCHDKSASSKFKNVAGYVAAGQLTTAKLKSAVTAAGVGAHFRTNGKEHSMVIIGVTDSGFTVTDANADGKLTIRVATYTWSSYVNSTFGKRGIQYMKKYVG